MGSNTTLKNEGAFSDKDQETALVVCPYNPKQQDHLSLTPEDKEQEAIGLTKALELCVVHSMIVRLSKMSPGSLFGKGKIEEIKSLVEINAPNVVIINHPLTPVQQRNLEKKWNVKVIDRTGLILEIFGARAQTREGKIQVELAALEYQKTRLVRAWTHLERQRGGAGFMGGPGETQIEIDRRLISERIVKLKKDLQQVKKNRDLQKRNRQKVPFPIVSLVGYTNAGKSTLFNALTNASVMAEDLLFATLDPTMRKLSLPNESEIILSDTVGFIADLPTHLIAAFRGTLEHVQDAEIILHVIDVSQENYQYQRDNVIEILQDLGIEYETDQRIIEVYNKIDALETDEAERLKSVSKLNPGRTAVSALEQDGFDDLLSMIVEKVGRNRRIYSVEIPHTDGQALAWLYQHAHIIEKDEGEESLMLQFDIEPADMGRFEAQFEYDAKQID